MLDRRLRMGKAKALYDWKRQLKAVVWAERKQREVARTEEALRTESRQEPEIVNIKVALIVSSMPSPSTKI